MGIVKVDPGRALRRVDLSVVVPAFDEADNLVRLASEVSAALDPTGLEWELVVVDDGSDDATPAVLARLAAADGRVRPLRLPRRSGQTAALVAGFHVARGHLIATLDADLQCSPRELPLLIGTLADADLACGIRASRHDPPTRRLASACANAIRRAIVAPGVRDLACPLRVFRRDALARVEATMPLFDGAHRWLPALFDLAGLRTVQRAVPHHPRVAGISKYTTRGRLGPVVRELGRVVPLVLERSRARRVAVGLAVTALLSVPFFYALGRWPLVDPDEGRNAEVAREMLAAGWGSVPHFNGLPYLDKPVLLFWTIAAAFRVLGVGELGARLPAALSATIATGLTFAIARRLLDARRGIVAALIFATMPLVIVFARLAIFDMPLTALVTAALYCLVRMRLDGRPGVWAPLAGLAMGLATLMKGPVGVAAPLIAWFAARGALSPGRKAGVRPVLAGVAVAAAIVVPWLVAVMRHEPDFLHYALVDETFLRLTSTERFHRGAAPWFYLEVLAWAPGVWALAVAALAPALLRRSRRGGPEAAAIAFAVRAALALVVFFTLSASKRVQYLLPAMVPVAILAAVTIMAERERVPAVARAIGGGTIVLGLVVLAIAAGGLPGGGLFFRLTSSAGVVALGTYLIAWGAVTLGAARTPALALACLAVFTPGLGIVAHGALDGYVEGHSARPLAAQIAPGARVVALETFEAGLPFYLRRPVPLVSRTGGELTSNYVESQAARLMGHDSLLPIGSLKSALGDASPAYVLASHWSAHRLSKSSPRRLVPVWEDGRRHVLFRTED